MNLLLALITSVKVNVCFMENGDVNFTASSAVTHYAAVHCP